MDGRGAKCILSGTALVESWRAALPITFPKKWPQSLLWLRRSAGYVLTPSLGRHYPLYAVTSQNDGIVPMKTASLGPASAIYRLRSMAGFPSTSGRPHSTLRKTVLLIGRPASTIILRPISRSKARTLAWHGTPKYTGPSHTVWRTLAAKDGYPSRKPSPRAYKGTLVPPTLSKYLHDGPSWECKCASAGPQQVLSPEGKRILWIHNALRYKHGKTIEDFLDSLVSDRGL